MKAKGGGVAWVIGFTFVGGIAWGGIEGSKHDFSSREWSGGDACAACHTPQKDKAPEAAPLWEQSADLNRTFGTPLRVSAAAGGGTTICLRCHDGTIARDTVSTATKPRFVSVEHPRRFTTGHGTTDHPVGVTFPRMDQGFRSPSSVIASRAVTLPAGKVECISCHDPHDMAGERFMLVRSNARSALCLTCHRK